MSVHVLYVGVVYIIITVTFEIKNVIILSYFRGLAKHICFQCRLVVPGLKLGRGE